MSTHHTVLTHFNILPILFCVTKMEFLVPPLLLGQPLHEGSQQTLSWVGDGVDGVTHAIDQACPVKCLFVQEPREIASHLLLIGPVLQSCFQVPDHLHDLDVGAAVLWAL